MAEIHDQFAEAFRESRSAFGVPITFGATAITAIVSESPMGRELVEGGFQTDADCVAQVLLADLPATPALGSPVTYKGRRWKVSRVEAQPGHLVAGITIKPADR
jgi:hypothetical protein